jgi:4'-phosphopantetheinyl transferase
VRLSEVGESLRADVGRLLSPVERTRAAAYQKSADRVRFQLGVAISRLALARELGCTPAEIELDRACPDCARPHGKVRLVGPRSGWELSVTHSGDLVGVAVSTVAPLGLDVEEVRAIDVDSMAALVLTPDEYRAGMSPIDFLRYWTRKEAVVKSTGDGLRQPLNLFSVTPPTQRAAVIAWPGRDQTTAALSLHDLPNRAGHLASLAVLTTAEVTITEHDAKQLLHS